MYVHNMYTHTHSHTHTHLAAATRTLVEWVVFRRSPLEVVASTLASSCMRYSMLSGGGTNRADQTETSILESTTTTLDMVRAYAYLMNYA